MPGLLIERTNALHWEWLVYLEMFVAGVAAGAYFVAAVLEWAGRGRSPTARAAHGLVLPLVLVASLLLVVDLARPERFLHMVIESKTLQPMWKPWSPMSIGVWLLMTFGAVSFISFVDMLASSGRLHLGRWDRDHTIHGSVLGRILTAIGGILAFAVAAYSGVLLSATSIPVWAHSTLIGAVYIATAMLTGAAALVLIQAVRSQIDADVVALQRTLYWFIGWWVVLIVAYVLTLGEGQRLQLTGVPLVALILALLFGAIAPVIVRFTSLGRYGAIPLTGTLVLLGGFFLRYAMVMGPQYVH